MFREMCFTGLWMWKRERASWEASAKITDSNISIVTEIFAYWFPFSPRRIHNCSRGYSNARASLNARIRQNQSRETSNNTDRDGVFARGCCDSIMETVEKRLSCWKRPVGWMQEAPCLRSALNILCTKTNDCFQWQTVDNTQNLQVLVCAWFGNDNIFGVGTEILL